MKIEFVIKAGIIKHNLSGIPSFVAGKRKAGSRIKSGMTKGKNQGSQS